MITLKDIYSDPFTSKDIDLLLENVDVIVDSLDSKDIKIDDESSKIFGFEISELKYEVRFDIQLTKNNEKIAEVKFYLLNNPKKPKRKDFNTDNQFDIAMKKSQVGITNTGHYFSVLSYVVNIIKMYCEKHKVDYITFTADEKNRQQLYMRVLKKVIDKYKLPYFQIFKNPINGEELNDEEFWLKRL